MPPAEEMNNQKRCKSTYLFGVVVGAVVPLLG